MWLSSAEGMICFKHTVNQMDGIALCKWANVAQSVHHTAISLLFAGAPVLVRCSADFSLICFNDEFPLSNLKQPLTCVSPDTEVLGRTAAMYLLNMLSENEQPLTHVTRIPNQLAQQASTAVYQVICMRPRIHRIYVLDAGFTYLSFLHFQIGRAHV